MTLAAHQFSVTDEAGNVVAGAHVEVRQEVPGQPLAALYSDRDGLSALGNPFDADGGGFARFFVVGGFYQVRVYTGASGAPTFEAPLHRYVGIGLNSGGDTAGSRVKRTVTAAGAVTADPDDDIIIINKTVGAATTVNVNWATRTRPLTIVDGKGDANTNNITIVPSTGQTQYAIADHQVIIDGNGGSVTLTPLPDGSGAF